MDNKILVTGGDGRFAKILKDKNKKLNLIFCSKKQLDILNLKSIKKNFEKHRQKKTDQKAPADGMQLLAWCKDMLLKFASG